MYPKRHIENRWHWNQEEIEAVADTVRRARIRLGYPPSGRDDPKISRKK